MMEEFVQQLVRLISKISSWIEQGPATSVSTANSKKSADELGKANQKRLKPGESLRPRPKDRQMIQDRVKELRDIIPNGAKCSIDSLLEGLERTIKRMLILQSVASHADKLKHTESKGFSDHLVTASRPEIGLVFKQPKELVGIIVLLNQLICKFNTAVHDILDEVFPTTAKCQGGVCRSPKRCISQWTGEQHRGGRS